MNIIEISIIRDEDEIALLSGKSSFDYVYDDKLINLLKKNFELDDSLYLIARSGGEFAGFCSVDRDWWEDGWFFIREILVDSKFREDGIGEKLMTKCIEHAKCKGAEGIVTETSFKNIPMQKLCAKLGFEKRDNPKWKEGVTYKILL